MQADTRVQFKVLLERSVAFCRSIYTEKAVSVGGTHSVFVAEPKPSANLVAEPSSAMFCLSPPQAGSGRTYGCLIRKQMKFCYNGLYWRLGAS